MAFELALFVPWSNRIDVLLILGQFCQFPVRLPRQLALKYRRLVLHTKRQRKHQATIPVMKDPLALLSIEWLTQQYVPSAPLAVGEYLTSAVSHRRDL